MQAAPRSCAVLLTCLAALGLLGASCGSSRATRPIAKGHGTVRTTGPVQTSGALKVLPPSAAERLGAERFEVRLADLPSGWGGAQPGTPISDLPPCGGYPAVTLDGPVASVPLGKVPTASVPYRAHGGAGSSTVATEAKEEVASGVWVAQSSTEATDVVRYLASASGMSCLVAASPSGKVERSSVAVPGASAVASYSLTASSPPVSGEDLFFAKGSYVVELVFLSVSRPFPASVLSSVVDASARG